MRISSTEIALAYDTASRSVLTADDLGTGYADPQGIYADADVRRETIAFISTTPTSELVSSMGTAFAFYLLCSAYAGEEMRRLGASHAVLASSNDPESACRDLESQRLIVPRQIEGRHTIADRVFANLGNGMGRASLGWWRAPAQTFARLAVACVPVLHDGLQAANGQRQTSYSPADTVSYADIMRITDATGIRDAELGVSDVMATPSLPTRRRSDEPWDAEGERVVESRLSILRAFEILGAGDQNGMQLSDAERACSSICRDAASTADAKRLATRVLILVRIACARGHDGMIPALIGDCPRERMLFDMSDDGVPIDDIVAAAI